MTENEKIMKEALERIRDDYGELWGGSRDEDRGGRRIMVCCYCDEESPDSYHAIKHDEECAVTLAGRALSRLNTASPSPDVGSLREALKDASPAEPPVCADCGSPPDRHKGDAKCPGYIPATRRPLAGKTARHLEDVPEVACVGLVAGAAEAVDRVCLEELGHRGGGAFVSRIIAAVRESTPAGPPVALRPAREVAHEHGGHSCGTVNGEIRHSPWCNAITEAVEADRLPGGHRR